ncbi:unnamed protein product, partial [Gulo gulo]
MCAWVGPQTGTRVPITPPPPAAGTVQGTDYGQRSWVGPAEVMTDYE